MPGLSRCVGGAHGSLGGLCCPLEVAPRARRQPHFQAHTDAGAGSHGICCAGSLAPDRPYVCARRHLCLIRWDNSEYRRSLPADRKHVARDQDQRLLEGVREHFAEHQLRPPNYLSVLRDTASVVDRDPDEVEVIWRASSGSAHGKRWPAHALQRVTPGEEYEPGQFRTMLMPDPNAMTRALDIADALLTYGVSRFLQLSGADFAAAHQDAMQWLQSVVPMSAASDSPVAPGSGV